MKHDHARRLLDRIGVLHHPCDIDLLLFFVRHPRALLTSDQIATFLGYEVKQLGDSLNVLVRAELVARTQRLTSAPRMYVFASGGTRDGWLPSLLELAATREGRLAMREALKNRIDEGTGRPMAPPENDPIVKAG